MNPLRALLSWLTEEKRLAFATDWHAGVYHNRPTVQAVANPLTVEDPRCKALRERQREARERLLLCGIGAPRVPVSASWAHDERAFRFVRRER